MKKSYILLPLSKLCNQLLKNKIISALIVFAFFKVIFL